MSSDYNVPLKAELPGDEGNQAACGLGRSSYDVVASIHVPWHVFDGQDSAQSAMSAVEDRTRSAVPLPWDEVICWTICSARTLTLMLARCEARRSRSNASSGPHLCWAITMPLACSITGMLSSRAWSRANAESCSISRWDRPFWTRSRVACTRALVSSTLCEIASQSSRAASSRAACSCAASSAEAGS
jgi:hypothetical protein